jgi:hypothetical protein
MQTLAHALSQISKDTELGKMVSKAAVKKKKIVRKKKKLEISKDPAKIFRKRIRKTVYFGIGNLRPCQFLAWRPGRPALADGKPGRIKWGLSDGNLEFVVVMYDFPQPLYGTESTVEYGLVPLSKLSKCDCAGYLHKKHCKPKRRKQ